MSTIKRYTVTHQSGDHEVMLEVDHSILTPGLAREHLEFWSGGDDFADDEDGNEPRALIRLFGANAIRAMLEANGCDCGDDECAAIYTRELQDEEGWGGSDGTPFGRVGIRIVRADVDGTGFDDVSLQEVTQ